MLTVEQVRARISEFSFGPDSTKEERLRLRVKCLESEVKSLRKQLKAKGAPGAQGGE
jgi:hypothetical protein